MNEIEEKLLDQYLEHTLEKMERRKVEIQDENYIVTRAVGTQLVKRE